MTMMIATFNTLADIRPADAERIGGKAYNCARLLQAGFPVPDGIVVPADAADDDIRALPSHPWFDALPADAVFAVRSSGIGEDSAGHSFAGIHETQLNVPRRELVEAVLVCRRSAASTQAIAYRRSRHIEEDGPVIGVLVQRMVPARVSGVAFTMNPVTGANELVINAAPGLGEALVSGQIEPDEFILRKRDFTTVSVRLAGSGAPVLTGAQLSDLGALLARIEQHYGTPQDVEFCHDGDRFWIVQSRPVTTAQRVTLEREASASLEREASASLEREASVERAPVDIEWTRANLAEVLPEQMSPQTLAEYEKSLNDGERMFMGRLLAPELGPIFKSFHGRMYINLTQMRRVMRLTGTPAADMLRSLGHAEAIDPADEVASRPTLREILPVVPDFVRMAIYDARAEKLLRRHEADTKAVLERLAADPATLSDQEIWDAMRWWMARVPAAIQIVFVMSGVQFRESALKKIAQKVGFPYERLVYPHLAAGPRSVSSQQAVDLVGLTEVARRDPHVSAYLLANDGSVADLRDALAGSGFLKAFDRFLDQYGHRGRYESDWSLPRLHEDPRPVLFAIREQLQGPPQDLEALSARQNAEAAQVWREFESRLTWWQRLTLGRRTRSLLRRLKNQYVWREQVRSDLTKILRRTRAYHLALAERFVLRGWIERRDDYFFLQLEDVGSAIEQPVVGRALRAIIERRKARMAEERNLELPLLMRESQLSRLMAQKEAPAISASGPLTGLCVSPGTVEAEVVVIGDPGEFACMKRGAILVTRATDPSWTPLFTLASGVIVEVGGMLSHASTIAREYGLPALANVKHATRVLRTGDRVRLDASGGRVVPLGR